VTSRERVRKALNHHEPDRIPIDNNGIVSSIHEVAYQNLLVALDLHEDVVILDPVQRIVLNSEQVLDALLGSFDINGVGDFDRNTAQVVLTEDPHQPGCDWQEDDVVTLSAL